ncbi:hypothetical protein [Neisseria sp. Ec49-e6-T10]|uniref:hypothetical protein n=1 Tax=Neisseria sp. Ec49-e6-T10 TaxID=3140744 RepID=UPI003EB6AFB8
MLNKIKPNILFYKKIIVFLCLWLFCSIHLAVAQKANQPTPYPQTILLKYQGIIPGEMYFEQNGTTYTILTTLQIPFKIFTFKTEGKIINNQLVPLVYTDTRGGQLYAQAEFDYEKKHIIYGKSNQEKLIVPMQENALDIFSLPWQLALSNGQLNASVQITNGKSVSIYPLDQMSISSKMYQVSPKNLHLKLFSTTNNKHIEYGLATDLYNVPAYISFEGYTLYPERIIVNAQQYWQSSQIDQLKKPNTPPPFNIILNKR